jgi:threonine dehydrogenase-like Zn-dependent dehydrogenase
MQAVAVVPRSREMTLIDAPRPRVTGPSDVALRILDVGVCGTDREIASFHYGTPPPGDDHLILGHESLGVVTEVGAAVSRVRVGDLVVPTVRRPCAHAHCTACRAGRQDFCYTGDFTEHGIKQRHGFMTEVVVEDERYMNVVPAALRDVGVLVEPLTIAEKALAQVASVQRRLPWACDPATGRATDACHRAVVLGAGPVALLGAMALATRGFEVSAYSREPASHPKAAAVQALGGRYVSTEETSVEELAEQIGNIDLVYEATGAASVSFELLKVLGTNGVFVFTGVPGRKAAIEIDAGTIMRNLVLKNQIVFGTVNASRDAFEQAIVDLAEFERRWPHVVRGLITGRHPVQAYRDVLVGPPQGVKDVLTFGR